MSYNNHDLFNNPMIDSALKALSPEDVEKYKKIGEEMYGNMNFVDSEILNNMPAPIAEAVAYISESIKSGLHPSMLDENEIKVLEEAYGENWYLKFDYCKEDLQDFVTLKK